MSIERLFIDYINTFPDTDMTLRKKLHSLHVASLAGDIGQTDKHFEAGLIHDTGRFFQAVTYKTFNDSASINHGEYGYEVVKSWGVTDSELLNAVRYHNRLEIPDIPEKEFVCVIRDADIIDILDLTAKGEINIFGKHNAPDGELTEQVKELLTTNKLLPNPIRFQSGINSYLGKLALVFGLTYKESYEILEKKEILKDIITVHVEDNETEKFLKKLYDTIYNYKEKLKRL